MRKSIFLTAILALFFMGLTVQVNAQTGTDDSGATKTPTADCGENENFPAIGIPHAYEVAISGTGSEYNGDGTYKWYVTKDSGNLLSGTIEQSGTDKYFVVTPKSSELSTYNSEADTKKKIELTWNSKALIDFASDKKPYFLVLKYSEDNGTCTAMNMKVMKIEPLNRFKLDIEPVKDETGTAFGGTESATVCAADVDGATYDAGTNKVKYTYGQNKLYYKITAKGFIGKWKPQLKVPALSATGEQKYVSAKWKKVGGSTWNDFSVGTNSSTQTLTSTVLAEIPAPTTAGDEPTQDYIVEIVIDNEKYETLTDQTLSVATDGTYGGTNNESLKDQKDNCSGDEEAFDDKDDYTIKARPTVKATSGGFIQKVK